MEIRTVVVLVLMSVAVSDAQTTESAGYAQYIAVHRSCEIKQETTDAGQFETLRMKIFVEIAADFPHLDSVPAIASWNRQGGSEISALNENCMSQTRMSNGGLSLDIPYDPNSHFQVLAEEELGDCYLSTDSSNDLITFNGRFLLIAGDNYYLIAKFSADCSIEATRADNNNNIDIIVEDTDVEVPTVTPSGEPISPLLFTCYITETPNVPGSEITTLKIGALFYIMCTLIVDENELILGVHFEDVIVASDTSMSGQKVYFIKDGCVPAADSKGTQALFFNKDVDVNAQQVMINQYAAEGFNDTQYRIDWGSLAGLSMDYMMGPFRALPMLANGNNKKGKLGIAIRVIYEFACNELGELMCTDQQGYCKATGGYARENPRFPQQDFTFPIQTTQALAIRRRRSAQEYKSLTLNIDLLDDTNKTGGTNTLNQNGAEDGPNPQTFYWMLAAILSVLLLLIVIVCVVLALRLRRRRLYKEEQFEGHKNPAYN